MIAHKHRGSIGFKPLPASDAEAPWVGRKLSEEQAGVQGKRILLVEDQELVRASLRMMLELDGHQVTEACNGVEGLNSFTIGEFDLVITDYEMPMMTGNKLAAHIKQLVPSLPVLMVTASDTARRDVENPVDALINKPFTVQDLRGALVKVLSARPGPAQPGALLCLKGPLDSLSTTLVAI